MKLPDGVTEIPGPNLSGRKYPHRDLTEKIIGCAIAVHKELQAGYVEAIYENALAHELRKSGLHVEQQVKFPVYYDGVTVGEHRADLIVERKVVVELKAVSALGDQHVSQVMSTLRAAGIKVGLLLNFNEARVVNGLRRIIM